jgi:hypothetical protein
MGTETNDAMLALDGTGDFTDPVFGRKGAAPLFDARTEIRYLVGCLSNKDTQATAERLMTASLRCGGPPKKPGDVAVISESSSWDKEGLLNVVIKYLIIPEADKHAE